VCLRERESEREGRERDTMRLGGRTTSRHIVRLKAKKTLLITLPSNGQGYPDLGVK